MSGRKTLTVIIPKDYGRDSGKHFLLTEMPAARAEKWALRMVIAVKGSGAEIPESAQRLGSVGIAFAFTNMFLRAEINPDVLEPLLDDMMTCVEVIRDLKHPDVVSPLASDDDIQEVYTRLWLRNEIIKLHTDFSFADAFWTWASAASKVMTDLQSAQTSPE